MGGRNAEASGRDAALPHGLESENLPGVGRDESPTPFDAHAVTVARGDLRGVVETLRRIEQAHFRGPRFPSSLPVAAVRELITCCARAETAARDLVAGAGPLRHELRPPMAAFLKLGTTLVSEALVAPAEWRRSPKFWTHRRTLSETVTALIDRLQHVDVVLASHLTDGR